MILALKLSYLRILLHGRPGTGKTSKAISLCKDYERVTLTQGMFPDALLGKFLLRDGSTQWAHAFAGRAAMRGVPVIFDEIDKAGPELDSTLQSCLDDEKICVLNLDSGEAIKPQAGYQVIATMNGSPDVLAPAVLDRFDLVIRCDTPATGLLAVLDEDMRHFINNKMLNESNSRGENWVPDVSPRRGLIFCKLRAAGLPAEVAAEVVFGELQGPTILTALVDAARNTAAAEGRLPL